MSRRRADRPPLTAAAASPEHAPFAGDRFWQAATLVCGLLFVARFLVPAESAEEGETLWIVVGWLTLAAGVSWIAWRTGRFPWRPGWPEFALAALVGCQTLSGLAVVLTAGQRRAAINLVWEWIGVGVALGMLRFVAREEDSRRRLWKLLLTVGLVLAALGVWQRSWWYPRIRAAYQEWVTLSSTETPLGMSPQERERRRESLQRDLGPEVLALHGPAEAALRQRILDSSEPFGRFGLANTFAGVLAVVLVLLVAVGGAAMASGEGGVKALFPRRAFDRLRVALGASAILLVGTTLLLTRSRTAWLAAWGALVTLGLGVVARRGSLRLRQVMIGGVLALVALVPLAALAIVSGAIDRQDLTEAPKSVLYRLQYWTGAWQVIREHPWLGVGPGNFRQHYLRYKLPEASEEISDPHNLFFDVTASAGLPGLAALTWLLVLAARRWWLALAPSESRDHALPRTAAPGSQPAAPWTRSDLRWLWTIGLLACGVVFLVQFVFQVRIDWQLAWLAAGWLPAAWVVERLFPPGGVTTGQERLMAAAAGIGLTIHLLTSGGIAMPVIVLLLLSLWFLVPGEEEREPGGRVDAASLPRWGTAAVAALSLLLVGCLATAWGPVTLARLHLHNGTAALFLDRRPAAAADHFIAAAQADCWDPRPWRALGFAEAALWQQGGRDAERHFRAAVAALEQARRLDPFNPHAARLLGDLWLRRALSSGDRAEARAAADWFLRAAEGYPHSSVIQAELCEALLQAGDRAGGIAAARRALELDSINETWLHIDKLLPEDRRRRLRELAGDPSAETLSTPPSSAP